MSSATPELADLARGWAQLRLAAKVPERVAAWDLVLLTVTSPEQATLCERQLAAVREAGLLPAATAVLAVPDPDGLRVGSGTATLHALVTAEATLGALDGRRVLLVHAGGDSRRLPWANPIGKCFLPLPLLTEPDERLPTLFDHLLAIAAPAAAGMPGGGMLVLTGDVLPGMDVRSLHGAPDAVVVTAPASLDVAGRHGVIVDDGSGGVARLLQKATPEALAAAGAVAADGTALIDTGIFRFAGAAWRSLLACSRATAAALVAACRTSGRGISLYEELAGALVPANRAALAADPVASRLLPFLTEVRLHHHRCDGFRFWHFGTTGELLDLYASGWGEQLDRRVQAVADQRVDRSAVVLASRIAPGACIGAGCVVHECRLGPGVRVGSRSVLAFLDWAEPLTLPANTALWQVPLAGGGQLTACLGTSDDPKLPLSRAILFGRPLAEWLRRRELPAATLWADGEPHDLWHARLFPIDDGQRGEFLAWLLAETPSATTSSAWRTRERLSLAGLHRRIDYAALAGRSRRLSAALAWQALEEICPWPADRHLAALAARAASARPAEDLRDCLGLLPGPAAGGLPASRLEQVRADLLRAAGDEDGARRAETAADIAVAAETASGCAHATPPLRQDLKPGAHAECALPVRFDLAGGWSDTPPWCLERLGRVVNLAARLDGALPISCTAELVAGTGRVQLADDGGRNANRSATDLLAGNPDLRDPFALVHAGLLVTGLAAALPGSGCDLRLATASAVPRGSGLGASSILAAAVATCLQRLVGGDATPGHVQELVLALEQRLGTGGGWQDQVGGLHPGAKCSTSHPGQPLCIQVEPLRLHPAMQLALETRLVPVFTGQERLARNVLQIVVRRYLQRDAQVLRAIGHLAHLAEGGRGPRGGGGPARQGGLPAARLGTRAPRGGGGRGRGAGGPPRRTGRTPGRGLADPPAPGPPLLQPRRGRPGGSGQR